jgi:hypothetical protein
MIYPAALDRVPIGGHRRLEVIARDLLAQFEENLALHRERDRLRKQLNTARKR